MYTPESSTHLHPVALNSASSLSTPSQHRVASRTLLPPSMLMSLPKSSAHLLAHPKAIYDAPLPIFNQRLASLIAHNLPYLSRQKIFRKLLASSPTGLSKTSPQHLEWKVLRTIVWMWTRSRRSQGRLVSMSSERKSRKSYEKATRRRNYCPSCMTLL